MQQAFEEFQWLGENMQNCQQLCKVRADAKMTHKTSLKEKKEGEKELH